MKQLLLGLVLALLLSGCTIPFIGQKQAALQINANPEASIFLNGNHVGTTPFFDDKLKPGEYQVKLAVEGQNQEWQTTVTLSPQIITVLNRKFGATPEESSNYLLQLEPLANKSASEISIISIPDNVIVRLDGQPKGFSPLVIDDIEPGDHTLVLSAPGYQEQTIQAQVKEGYKLVASAQLAKTTLDLEPAATDSADQPAVEDTSSNQDSNTSSRTQQLSSPTSTSSGELERPYVEITETGTGWLRVRSEPDSNADNEVAKIDVGTKHPWIEANDTGWYKIEYTPGKQGWISGRYATLYK